MGRKGLFWLWFYRDGSFMVVVAEQQAAGMVGEQEAKSSYLQVLAWSTESKRDVEGD